ncbi:nucleotide sugar dehydrogenase [Aureibaculum conchae]|uniref:nucleotide sugar dehydrogenase n=1 Tax=Aureibaculum sp. 2308TA14-22 TaxID=3108392 RepID=UPI0033952B9F
MNYDVSQYLIYENQTIKDVLKIFQNTADSGLPAGIAILSDKSNKVIGCVTEGDVRRGLIQGKNLNDKIDEIAVKNPICFNENYSYKDIIEKIPQELSLRGRKSKKYLDKIIVTNNDNELVKIIGYHELWEQKVATHRHVVVLGLGYVGLTLALVLAEEGFFITGVDTDTNKIKKLNKKDSYVIEKGLPEILKEQLGKNFHPSVTIPEEGDVYVISVGTPVVVVGSDKNPTPILDFIETISKEVGKKLKPGNLVILRSTVPTGTSRNVVGPLLEKHSGLICGKDFHLAFAPERTAEGKALKELRELPQIIGGVNEESVESTAALFRELTPTIIRVSSLETAEMAKLINNSFRDLVFAYSNYVTQIASHFNIDIVEIIKAANQGYPRDTVPLPSPGVGGPCLTKDPYIFSTVAEKVLNGNTSLFNEGRYINENMHEHIAIRVINELKNLKKDIKKCKILVCGLAFKGKPETGDVRNSSAVEIYNLLSKLSTNISGHDPVALTDEIKEVGVNPIDFEKGINDADVVLFLNNNDFYEKLNIFNVVRKMNKNPIIVDGWSLYRADEIISVKPSVYMSLSQIKSSII